LALLRNFQYQKSKLTLYKSDIISQSENPSPLVISHAQLGAVVYVQLFHDNYYFVADCSLT